jgi:hypothetical protein
MNASEWITRLTALGAVTMYGASLLVDRPQGPLAERRAARWLWTAGAVIYVVHVVCAFALMHDWSHAAAYRHTAARTAELVGLDWGGGLYLNHVFTVVWIGDALWWWLRPASYQARPAWMRIALRGYLAFMVFQATVVFGSWPAQVLGGAIFLAWGAKTLRQGRKKTASTTEDSRRAD